MAFPRFPKDNEVVTENGIQYIYTESNRSWKRTTNNNIDRITLSGNFESTSTRSGTLVVTGGIGASGNLNVGRNVRIFGTATSTSTTTGALIVGGGIGIHGDIHLSGKIFRNGEDIASDPWIYTNLDIIAKPNARIMIDTSVVSLIVTLPANPKFGTEVHFLDYAGTFGRRPCLFRRNGEKIMGKTEDFIVNLNNAANKLVYTGSAFGWKLGMVL